MPIATFADVAAAQRVLLHGVTGSGKSTAAMRIGAALDLPVHLVDDEIGWLPGWVNRPADDELAIATELAAADRWVFDSTYSTFREPVLARTQVVVGLDYPRWLSLWRLIRRTIARIVDKEEICNGNVEGWTALFSGDSIILWHFKSFKRKRNSMRAMATAHHGPPTLLLRHPRELDALISFLESPAGRASAPLD